MENNQKINSSSNSQDLTMEVPMARTYSEKGVLTNIDELATKKELLELENKYLKYKISEQKWLVTTAISLLGLAVALYKLLF